MSSLPLILLVPFSLIIIFICVLFVCSLVSGVGVSVCDSLIFPGTQFVDIPGVELIEICPRLPP